MRAAGPLLDDEGYFHLLVAELLDRGFAEQDVEWSEGCGPPGTSEQFALETAFVICNSGMHNKVARAIFDKVSKALAEGRSATEEFGHDGKASAIDEIWRRKEELLAGYLEAGDKLAFCRSIPWIGGITCYHLAKNFGAQVAKPDVHLQKLADRHGTGVQELCEAISDMTGFKVPTVDLVLWRACAERIIDPRTALRPEPTAKAARIDRTHQHEMFQPTQRELF